MYGWSCAAKIEVNRLASTLSSEIGLQEEQSCGSLPDLRITDIVACSMDAATAPRSGKELKRYANSGARVTERAVKKGRKAIRTQSRIKF